MTMIKVYIMNSFVKLHSDILKILSDHKIYESHDTVSLLKDWVWCYVKNSMRKVYKVLLYEVLIYNFMTKEDKFLFFLVLFCVKSYLDALIEAKLHIFSL